jgi:hypothetical protein
VIVSTCYSGHYLQQHLRFWVRLTACFWSIFQWYGPRTRFLRENFATRRIHAKRCAICIMIRQIIVIKQLLSRSFVATSSIGIIISNLSLKLLVLFYFVFLLKRWIHIWLDWLLAITSGLKDLCLVLRLLISESV